MRLSLPYRFPAAGRVLVSLGAFLALVVIPASAVTTLTGEYEYTTSSDPLSLLAINSNTTSGAGAIQGNSYAAGGKGVFGYSDASGAPGFGLAGISQNGYGVYGSSYGVGITAIYGENLSGGGIGMEGASSGGNGVYGLGAQNGVVGETTATSGTYAGVIGVDNSSGNGYGYGLYGSSTGNHTGVGAFATSNGLGLYAQTMNGLAAIEGDAAPASGGLGLIGLSTGQGGEFIGFSGSSAAPALTASDAVGGTDLFGTYAFNAQEPLESFVVQAASLNSSGDVTYAAPSDVQISGDLYVGGAVFSDCPAFPETAGSNCGDSSTFLQRSSTGAALKTFTPHQSMSSMEDFGEAQLVNGHSFVPLDPTFASSIAHDRSYLVFVTAEGDCHGLYVTGKTLTGFAVREFTGGHSSIAFQYRIVAHPYGETATRMLAILSKQRQSFGPRLRLEPRALKKLLRPASVGARVTRPPHVWVQDLHRL